MQAEPLRLHENLRRIKARPILPENWGNEIIISRAKSLTPLQVESFAGEMVGSALEIHDRSLIVQVKSDYAKFCYQSRRANENSTLSTVSFAIGATSSRVNRETLVEDIGNAETKKISFSFRA